MNAYRNMTNRLLPLSLMTGLLSVPVVGAGAPAKSARSPLYDEQADGANQIADAMVLAKKENKRVLLQFGANWCGWCHRLHGLFQTNALISAKFKEAYVVVLVDVNKGHNAATNEKYGNPAATSRDWMSASISRPQAGGN